MAKMREKLQKVFDRYNNPSNIQPGDFVTLDAEMGYISGFGCDASIAELFIVLEKHEKPDSDGEDCKIAFFDSDGDLIIATGSSRFLVKV